MKASKSLLLRKPAPTTVNEEPGDDLADVTPEPEFPEYLDPTTCLDSTTSLSRLSEYS